MAAPDSACVHRLCGFSQNGLDQAPRGIGEFLLAGTGYRQRSTLGFAVSVTVMALARVPIALGVKVAVALIEVPIPKPSTPWSMGYDEDISKKTALTAEEFCDWQEEIFMPGSHRV